MGYPTEVIIGDNLVFSIVSHDPDTGVVTDAAGSVPYRVYRDMETTALLTGNMTLMVDDAGAGLTTGLYRALIACTAANGFENGKTYTVYIEATVVGDKGGISFDFKAQEGWALASLWTEARAGALTDWINGQRLDLILDAILAMLDDARAEPGQGAPAVNPDAMTKLDYLYKAWRNKATQTASAYSLYADDGTTVDQAATISDDATTATKGEIGTGA